MTISEIVKEHGLPVRIGSKNKKYKPFVVTEQGPDGSFRVRYDSGWETTVVECPWLDDYERVEEPGTERQEKIT